MNPIILPKLAPAQAVAATLASEQKSASAASSEPFQNFLDASQSGGGGQSHESDSPASQTREQSSARKTSKTPAATSAPATASVMTISAPPQLGRTVPNAKETNQEASETQPQGTASPEAALQAASIQSVLPTVLPATPATPAAKSLKEAGSAPAQPTKTAAAPVAMTPAIAATQAMAAATVAQVQSAKAAPAPISSPTALQKPAPQPAAISTIPSTTRQAAAGTATAISLSATPSNAAQPPALLPRAVSTVPGVAPGSSAPLPTASLPTAAAKSPASTIGKGSRVSTASASPQPVGPAEALVTPLPVAASPAAAPAAAPMDTASALPHSRQTVGIVHTSEPPTLSSISSVHLAAVPPQSPATTPAIATATATTTSPATTPKPEPGIAQQPLPTGQTLPAPDSATQAATPAIQSTVPLVATQAAILANASATTPSTSNGLPIAPARPKSKQAEIAGASPVSGDRQLRATSTQSSASVEPASTEAAPPIGIAFATQERAMSTAAQLPVPKTFFPRNATVAPAAPQPQAAATAKTAPQGRDSQQPASAPATPASTFSISSSAALAEKTLAAATTTTASSSSQGLAGSTLNQVLESAEKMTSAGANNVEVQVNLGNGQQLTVRLQMIEGSIHPIFKTNSPELRQAIEQNWSGFRTTASERGLQISVPVFESPSSGGSFDASSGRNQSQQPQGDPAESETASMPAQQNAANPTVTSPLVPAAAAGSSVQLYA